MNCYIIFERRGVYGNCYKYTVGILLFFYTFLFSIYSFSASNDTLGWMCPLSIQSHIAGTFGEIRNNHFHSGLDFRTNGQVGLPVHAVADGWVSRIRHKRNGFGNAVYITHANGYVTVYAHLLSFSKNIGQVLRNYQFTNQLNEVDWQLLKDTLRITKGEILGYAGNTGNSAGPHLHFETRNAFTEMIVNPFKVGFKIKDEVAPIISSIMMYELDTIPFNERTKRHFFRVIRANQRYRIVGERVIEIPKGKWIGAGLQAYDFTEKGGMSNGVYAASLFLDGQLIYKSVIDSFSFQDTKAVNSCIDYPYFKKTKQKIQKMFREPGNTLPIFETLVHNGRFHLTDNVVHELRFLLSDYAKNESELTFYIKGIDDLEKEKPTCSVYTKGHENCQEVPSDHLKTNYLQMNKPPKSNYRSSQSFFWNQKNTFEASNFKLEMPDSCLYDNIDFKYDSSTKNNFSNLYHIHNAMVPVHKPFVAFFKLAQFDIHFRDKMVVVGEDGEVSTTILVEDTFFKTELKKFGNYYLTIDSIPPRVLLISKKKNFVFNQSSHQLKFSVSDNLSGIDLYNVYIDGRWIPANFDMKSKILTIDLLDLSLVKGIHQLKLVVTDRVRNVKDYGLTFQYY